MRLRVDLHVFDCVDSVLGPVNMSLTRIHDILDEEWPKYRKAAVPNSSFQDWLIGSTGWGFDRWASGVCRWNAQGSQYKEEEPLPVSHTERIHRVVEQLGLAHHDLIQLADSFTGLRNNPDEMLVLSLLVSMTDNLRNHARGVQRRMGERA